MLAVKGYYDGYNYITEGNVAVKPNQHVIITFLEDDIEDNKKTLPKIQHKLENQDERIHAIDGIFGILSHEEAEKIRNNRVNFKERF
jgi:hypothetical protein